MKICLMFELIFLYAFVSVIRCDAGTPDASGGSQGSTNLVNITSAKLNYVNPEYVDKKTYKADFKRKNSTYTELPLQWDVIKDFPDDTMLITKLVRSKTENGTYYEMGTFRSKVCDLKDIYHKYLPPFLIELTKEGKCIKKGKYHFDDAGQFQFDKLFPAPVLKGWYYDTFNQIRASNSKVLIKDIEIKSKSVDN